MMTVSFLTHKGLLTKSVLKLGRGVRCVRVNLTDNVIMGVG
jgi:hypothetical protein